MLDERAARVFTYGTLQVREVMLAICGEEPADVSASLPGHARFRVRHAVYPGVLPTSGDDRVEGRLYTGVSALAVELLDRFEGDLYDRVSLPVALSGGSFVSAEVYVVRDALRHRLTDEPWDLARFAREHAPRYIEQCRGLHAEWRADASRALAARSLRA